MKIVVTEFGKFKYNCLPMGMCALVDILPAKVDKLRVDIKDVKKYIDDILVISKETLSNKIKTEDNIWWIVLIRLKSYCS